MTSGIPYQPGYPSCLETSNGFHGAQNSGGWLCRGLKKSRSCLSLPKCATRFHRFPIRGAIRGPTGEDACSDRRSRALPVGPCTWVRLCSLQLEAKEATVATGLFRWWCLNTSYFVRLPRSIGRCTAQT